MLKKLQLSFLFILLGFFSVYAQDSKKVLFLGNSYTAVNNLPSMIKEMALSSGDELIYDSNTPGGKRLMQHATDPISQNKIKAEDWDYVVLQGQSQETAFPESQKQNEVYPFVSILSDSIRANNACSQPMFYMTWGRKNGDASNCPGAPWFCEYETMDSAIRVTYIYMAEENDALLAPAGAVWHDLRTNHPGLNLYSADDSHPSVAGTYAAACAFYTMIYKKDPTLITWDSSLSASDAETIRMTAKNIVFAVIEDWDFSITPVYASFTETITDGEVNFNNTSTNYDSVVWDFGDGHTSTDDNSSHTYTENGEYTVTLTITVANCNQTDEITKKININMLGTDVFETNQLSVYPNPVENLLTLDFGKSMNNVQCKITDVSGRTLLKKVYNDKTKTTIDFSGFTKGIYFVKITTDGQIITQKVIKE